MGGKDKGKEGIICEIFDETNSCIVFGRNLKTSETKGSFLSYELPLSLVNGVSLIDPHDGKPCEVEMRKDPENVTF